MHDPFLDAHKIGPRLYTLTGKLSPASVRDQCVRAQLLVERLVLSEGLGAGHRILVVGDGISAAVTAAALCAKAGGPHVTVARLDDGFASIHQACRYRQLDPYVYDWPHIHSANVTFPLRRRAVIPWRADVAGQVAGQIVRDVGLVVNTAIRSGRADVHDHHAVVSCRPLGSSQWNLRLCEMVDHAGRWRKTANKLTLTVDALILCGGVHYEDNTFPAAAGSTRGPFISLRFWDAEDPLFELQRKAREGQPSDSGHLRVLIAGSGDGALQDYLYLLTGFRCVRDLLTNLHLGPAALQELQGLNSGYLRRYIASNRENDRDLFDDMHEQVESLCTQFWADPAIAAAVTGVLLPHQNRPQVQVACRQFHFSHSYLLNRILACLVARSVVQNGSPLVPFRMGVGISRITSHAPAAAVLRDGDDWACFPVTVDFTPTLGVAPPVWLPTVHPGRFGTPPSIYSSNAVSSDYDRVLLRIGAPPTPKVVPVYRVLNHGMARLGHKITPKPKLSSREIRQAVPFHL